MRIIDSIIYRSDLIINAAKYKYIEKDNKPHVMSSIETLIQIRDKHLSICRYGDGEFYLIFGDSLPFQQFDNRLQDKLKHVLMNQNKQILIGIPDTINDVSGYERKSKFFWKWFWGKYYDMVLEQLPENYKNIIYANTNCTRFYSDYDIKSRSTEIRELIELYREIWNGREVICIEGEKTRMGVGNDLFNNTASFKRILMPAENAFSAVDEALLWIRNKSIDANALFILACGPTATIMAYDLANMGYQALDLGHLDIQYEYYLRKSKGKIAIPGKYTNEAKNGRNPTDEIVDDEYKRSIIVDFS